MGKKKGFTYQTFLKEYAKEFPGPDLFKRAGRAWRQHGGNLRELGYDPRLGVTDPGLSDRLREKIARGPPPIPRFSPGMKSELNLQGRLREQGQSLRRSASERLIPLRSRMEPFIERARGQADLVRSQADPYLEHLESEITPRRDELIRRGSDVFCERCQRICR